jgi:hypothetical protein
VKTETPVDLSDFVSEQPRRYGARHDEPFLSLSAVPRTLMLNIHAMRGLGSPERAELLVNHAKRQLAIVPTANAEAGYRVFPARTLSSAAIYRLLAAVRPGGRWAVTMFPGPVGIVEIDNPSEEGVGE